MEIRGKQNLLLAASRGMERDLSKHSWKRGYNVVANSDTITKANPFTASHESCAGRCETSAIRARPQRSWTLPYRDLAGIDVLINNAGVFIPKSFTEYTTERLRHFSLHDARRLSLCLTTRPLKQMLRQTSGSISTSQRPWLINRSQVSGRRFKLCSKVP